MATGEIITVGDSTAVVLSEDTVRKLGAQVGDVLDVVILDNEVVLKRDQIGNRQSLVKAATQEVIQRRESALRKLAE